MVICFGPLLLCETFLQWVRIWTEHMNHKQPTRRKCTPLRIAALFWARIRGSGSRLANARAGSGAQPHTPARRKHLLDHLIGLCDTSVPLSVDIAVEDAGSRVGREVW